MPERPGIIHHDGPGLNSTPFLCVEATDNRTKEGRCFLRRLALQREYSSATSQPGRDLITHILTSPDHQVRMQRWLGGSGPLVPKAIKGHGSLRALPEQLREPDMYSRRFLQPCGQIVGIVGAHLPPDPLRAARLAPRRLAGPVLRCHEDEGGLGLTHAQGVTGSLLIVIVSLGFDVPANAHFPAGDACRHECGSGIGPRHPIPAAELDSFVRRKAQLFEVRCGRVDKLPDQARQLAARIDAARPESKIAGGDQCRIGHGLLPNSVASGSFPTLPLAISRRAQCAPGNGGCHSRRSADTSGGRRRHGNPRLFVR